MNKKIEYAIQLIKKYHSVMHVEKSDAEHFVFLFEYVSGKKAIHTNRIKKSVENAMRQQDYPKDVFYDQGMLYVKIETKPEVKEVIVESEPEITEIDSEITEAPKKKKTKKTIE